MARLATLASLRLQAQQRADMENSTFLSPTEWNVLINASATELYDVLTTVYEDYFQDSSTFTTSSGVSKYALPSDFYKMLGLDQNTGASVPVTCTPFQFAERNRFIDYNSPGQTFEVFYVPACPLLVADSDTFDGVNGWEEYIVIDAALKALIKEESPVGDLGATKLAIKKRIEESAPNRDAGMGNRVTDVHSVDPFYGITAPAPAAYRIMGGYIVLKSPQLPLGFSG